MKTLTEIYELYQECGGEVVTDTRKIDSENQGALFFALSGPNFNGNTFAEEAIQKACRYAIVDDPSFAKDKQYILVDNVLVCLQQLAQYHRSQFSGSMLAITGSNGKTTTKELIKVCLSKQYSVLATSGNLNNHIGVPLTLLMLRDDHDIAVIEMGTNNPGEIMALAKIANPDAALITSIGKAHLEGLGSLQGVATEKLSLFDYIRSRQALMFANIDSSYVENFVDLDTDNVIVYNQNSSLGFSIEVNSVFPILKGQIKSGSNSYALESSLFGQHNLSNITAALTVGFYFGVPLSDMYTAVNRLKLQNNRTETIQIGETQYYLDAYNANPSSMIEVIKAFGDAGGDSKMLILGDMFELGENEVLEHQAIVDLAIQYDWDIVLVGSIFHQTATSKEIKKFLTFEDLNMWFRKTALINNEILIKGSRGMGLERLIAERRLG